MNLNELAKEVTLKEGGKKSLGIGQVKEVMKLVLQKLAEMTPEQVEKILKKYRK
jgi:hypothetical protein